MHHQALLRQFSTLIIVVCSRSRSMRFEMDLLAVCSLRFWCIGVRAQIGLSFAGGRTGRSFADGSSVVDGVMA
jgi:hypothetical protein